MPGTAGTFGACPLPPIVADDRTAFRYIVEVDPPVTRILFICSRNRWRSPTAEQVFSERANIECSSAGLSPDAENPLTPELVEWAQTIFVMERIHRAKLASQFKAHLADKRVICLDIPDKYKFMDPALVKLLRAKVTRFLPPE